MREVDKCIALLTNVQPKLTGIMAANEQKIRLRVAGRVYEMKIAPEKEEIYRLAEKQVNANVGKLQKAYGESVSAQDCLAITSLMFAIDKQSSAASRQNQLSDEDMKALDDLSQKLDSHLNRISAAPRKGAKQ